MSAVAMDLLRSQLNYFTAQQVHSDSAHSDVTPLSLEALVYLRLLTLFFF